MSDPKKREIYDKYGEDGLKANAGDGARGAQAHYTFNDPRETFRVFFGTDDPLSSVSGIFGQRENMEVDGDFINASPFGVSFLFLALVSTRTIGNVKCNP